MAITRTGDFFEDLPNGTAGYGLDAPGSLTVNGGSDYVLNDADDSDGSEGPFLVFGDQAGSNGTGLVSGAGSSIQLASSAGENGQIQVRVGGAGAGLLRVENGGLLEVASTSAFGDGYSGIVVGRLAPGTGTLEVDAGTVNVSSLGTYFQVGRAGATGIASFVNGSSVNFTATGTGSAFGANVSVGREGGTGTLVVDDSTMTLDAQNGRPIILVGQNSLGAGNGTVVVRNGGDVTLEGIDPFVGVASQAGASGVLRVLSGGSLSLSDTNGGFGGSISIGHSASVTRAEVLVLGTGSRLDAGSYVSIGVDPSGGSPDTGRGVLTIDDGGTVTVEDGVVGRGGALVAGDGTLVVTGASQGFDVSGGFIRVLSDARFEVRGGLVVHDDGAVRFDIAADGSRTAASSSTAAAPVLTPGPRS